GTMPGAVHGSIVRSSQVSPVQISTLWQPVAVAGALAPTAGSLVDQFNCMHRQMIDQFQEYMSMTMQTLGDFQRDQTRLLQHQMDQLQDLTGQLRELHSELFQRLRNPEQVALASPKQI